MPTLVEIGNAMRAAAESGDQEAAYRMAQFYQNKKSEIAQSSAAEQQPTTDQQGNIIDYDKKLNAANAELNPVLSKAAPIYEPIARGGLDLLGMPADISGLGADLQRAISPSGVEMPNNIIGDKLREYAGSAALKRYAGVDNENRLYRPETSMGKVADYATEAGVSSISKNPVTMALGALGGAAGQGVRNIGGSDLEGAATEAAVAISPTIPGMIRSAERLGSRLFSPTGNVLGNAGYNRMSPEEIGAVFGEAANRIRNADQAGVRINAGQALQNPSISGVEQSLANSPATRDMIAEANAAQQAHNLETVKGDIVGNTSIQLNPDEGTQNAVDRLVKAGVDQKINQQMNEFKSRASELYDLAATRQLTPDQWDQYNNLKNDVMNFAYSRTHPDDPAIKNLLDLFGKIDSNPMNPEGIAGPVTGVTKAARNAVLPNGARPTDLQEKLVGEATGGIERILEQTPEYGQAQDIYRSGMKKIDALTENTPTGSVYRQDLPAGSYGKLTNSENSPQQIADILASLSPDAKNAANVGLRYNIGRSLDEMNFPVQMANKQLDNINPSELANKLSEYFGTPAAQANTRAQLIGTMGVNAGEQEFQKWKNIADNIALTAERRNISGSLQPTMETNEATRNAAKLATSMLTGDAFSATNALTRGLQYIFGREAKNRLASKFVAGSLPEGNKTAAEVGIDSVNRLRDAALNYSQWAKPLKESVGTSTEQLIRSLMRAKQREQEKQGSNQ